mmetsp:Transcript_18747/g.52179  ORF Transcript_18747/g.52179 Transcript_18747/m.52179 type:complete len:214 (-) Transcript_18747:1800-2441(-)
MPAERSSLARVGSKWAQADRAVQQKPPQPSSALAAAQGAGRRSPPAGLSGRTERRAAGLPAGGRGGQQSGRPGPSALPELPGTPGSHQPQHSARHFRLPAAGRLSPWPAAGQTVMPAPLPAATARSRQAAPAPAVEPPCGLRSRCSLPLHRSPGSGGGCGGTEASPRAGVRLPVPRKPARQGWAQSWSGPWPARGQGRAAEWTGSALAPQNTR